MGYLQVRRSKLTVEQLAHIRKVLGSSNVVLTLHVLAVDRVGKVLGDYTVAVDSFNARIFEELSEGDEPLVVVQAATELETTSPRV